MRMTATEPRRRTNPGRFLIAPMLLLVTALSGGPTAAQETAPPEPAATALSAPTPPTDLRDVHAWIAWKDAHQVPALPDEARLFFRRARIAQESGQTQQALEYLHGAIELDPSYLEPHVSLANWGLWHDPSVLLQELAVVLSLLHRDFALQASLAANLLVLGLEALFVGLLVCGLVLVLHRRRHLMHGPRELLARVVSPRTAAWWAMVLMALPFLIGFGITLPVLFLLAAAWPVLRGRERALTVALAVATLTLPLSVRALDRFTLALDTTHGPYRDLPLLKDASWDPALQSRLEQTAARAPQDPYAQFSLGWISRRGGHLETAEQAYRSTLVRWPGDAATLTDLGNVLAMQGRTDEALQCYAQASASDPQAAAPHFNASQLHLRRFEYTQAQEQSRRASSLDFDLVRRYQARSGESGLLPLVDVWPTPGRFWSTFRTVSLPASNLPLPFAMRGRREMSGWPFSLAALLALAAGLAWGSWQRRVLPLRSCANCGDVVCRRCIQRQREVALCAKCSRVAAGTESPEFSKVLLLRERNHRQRIRRWFELAFATLVPGYGLMARHRIVSPVVLFGLTWLTLRVAIDWRSPWSLTPNVSIAGSGVPLVLPLAGLTLLYTWSIGSYLWAAARDRAREAQLEAASRGRLTQATRRQDRLAA